jgi:hypothetical protein
MERIVTGPHGTLESLVSAPTGLGREHGREPRETPGRFLEREL